MTLLLAADLSATTHATDAAARTTRREREEEKEGGEGGGKSKIWKSVSSRSGNEREGARRVNVRTHSLTHALTSGGVCRGNKKVVPTHGSRKRSSLYNLSSTFSNIREREKRVFPSMLQQLQSGS